MAKQPRRELTGIAPLRVHGAQTCQPIWMIGNGMGQGLAWASVALMEHTGVTGQRGPLTASAVHRLGGGARLVVCNQLDAT